MNVLSSTHISRNEGFAHPQIQVLWYQWKQQINLLLGSFTQQLHKEAISFITAVYPPTQLPMDEFSW